MRTTLCGPKAESAFIFLGSQRENITLTEIPTTHEFNFQLTLSDLGHRNFGIANQHPRPGEKPLYIPTRTNPLTEDYFIVALIPGINPQHWMLMLAGTNTLETQAAVEFVCHPNTLGTLTQQLRPSGASRAFEALFHAKLSSGIPVESELVAVHVQQ
jgi:hypothetical protein